MKKRHVFLAFLAAGMVLTASVGSAWAYFTTYVEARGGVIISLGDETTVQENFSEWTKKIAITSESDSEPVYVRVKAFCSKYKFEYIDPSENKDRWVPGPGDYYYYREILKGGETTPELLVHIRDVPSDEVEQEDFNVIVIYETTPVQYDEDGKPIAPEDIDWNKKLDITRVEGGVSE